ncbi:unnamed protein product [Nesidiocoris tenuis]|uniref:Uncharacterized protein n=1 Tax=Nesidiocoris tenuis TaxID=355587 RepID=A0A6H5HH04_9HEMI|nr:unnamed protein product [Nesidiocoris tenuis]
MADGGCRGGKNTLLLTPCRLFRTVQPALRQFNQAASNRNRVSFPSKPGMLLEQKIRLETFQNEKTVSDGAEVPKPKEKRRSRRYTPVKYTPLKSTIFGDTRNFKFLTKSSALSSKLSVLAKSLIKSRWPSWVKSSPYTYIHEYGEQGRHQPAKALSNIYSSQNRVRHLRPFKARLEIKPANQHVKQACLYFATMGGTGTSALERRYWNVGTRTAVLERRY